MIVGTGLDLVEVERIGKALQQFPQRFRARVYTPREVAYCERYKNSAERYASRFAAKEAGMKALGTGWRGGIGWRDLEVVRPKGGRPTLEFHGAAARRAAALGVRHVALSLTHTATQAMANVILED